MVAPVSQSTNKPKLFISLNNYLEENAVNSTILFVGAKYKIGKFSVAGSVGDNLYTKRDDNNELLLKNRMVTELKATYTQPIAEINDKTLSLAFQARGRYYIQPGSFDQNSYQNRGSVGLVFGNSKGSVYTTNYVAQTNSGLSYGNYTGGELNLGEWSPSIECQLYHKVGDSKPINVEINGTLTWTPQFKKKKPKSLDAQY